MSLVLTPPVLPGQLSFSSPEDFDFLRRALFDRTGIFLSEAKRELVTARLRARLQALGLKDFESYRGYLESRTGEDPEWQLFINRLTTNKTEWFREIEHFELMVKELIPAWRKSGKKELSIWSAACSTGEEAYSLNLIFERHWDGDGRSHRILATDLDTEVLKHAKNGVFPKSQFTQIPAEYRNEAFAFGSGEISEWMKVKGERKRLMTFEPFNLSTLRYPWQECFDLILCRNVLIYFSREVVAQVVRNLHSAAAPGAYLLIGHSESIQNLDHPWKSAKPSVLVRGFDLRYGSRMHR